MGHRVANVAKQHFHVCCCQNWYSPPFPCFPNQDRSHTLIYLMCCLSSTSTWAKLFPFLQRGSARHILGFPTSITTLLPQKNVFPLEQIWCLRKRGIPNPVVTYDNILPGSKSSTAWLRDNSCSLTDYFYLFSYHSSHHIQTAVGNGQLPMPVPLANTHQSSNYCQWWKRAVKSNPGKHRGMSTWALSCSSVPWVGISADFIRRVMVARASAGGSEDSFLLSQ